MSGVTNALPNSYHDECAVLRHHLIGMLAAPAFGSRSWSHTMDIGMALINLHMQAESMDREARLGKYKPVDQGDCCAPDEPST